MIGLWLGMVVALAQDVDPPVGVGPGDGLVPSVFASARTVGEDSDTSVLAAGGLTVGWSHRSLVVPGEDRAAVVRDAVGLWATAGVGFGPLRVAAVVPGWLATSDRFEGARLTAGDIRLDVHFVPFRAVPGKPGFGLLVRGWVPLGATRLGLGAAGGAFEAVALIDGRVGPVELGGEVGYRGLPRVELGDVVADDGIVYRVSAAVHASERGGLALELYGRVGVFAPPRAETAPLEGLLSGWVEVSDDVRLRLGVGTALVRGVDAAPVRALFGVHARVPRERPAPASRVR